MTKLPLLIHGEKRSSMPAGRKINGYQGYFQKNKHMVKLPLNPWRKAVEHASWAED